MDNLFFFSYLLLFFISVLVYYCFNISTFLKAFMVVLHTLWLVLSMFFVSYYIALLFFLVIFGAFLIMLMYMMVLSSKEKGFSFMSLFMSSLIIFYLSKVMIFSYDLKSSFYYNEYLLDLKLVNSIFFVLLYLIMCMMVMKVMDKSRFSSLRKFY